MNRKAHSGMALLVSSLVKPASQLRGLTFGNKIDKLLQGGLTPKTLTFLYGVSANSMMNVLCANAVRIYGGRAIFIDAANSFDPYLIVERSNLYSKSERSAKNFIESIIVSRAFTCYQLRKLVTSGITDVLSKSGKWKEESGEQRQIRSVFVSGVGSLFTKEDNTPAEITRFELLMAQALRKIASDKDNGILFVVASSDTGSASFTTKSDTAIKLFHDYEGGKVRKQTVVEKAILMKHYSRKFETISL